MPNDTYNKHNAPNIRICGELGLHKKANLLEMKVNSMKDGKFVQTKISFELGHHRSSGLGAGLIVVVNEKKL